MLTAQFSALTILFSLCAWFRGHQASHCAAYRTGNVELSHPVAFIMGLETFLGPIFLAWFAYTDGISYAAGLFALSFVVRLALVKLENVLGLTQRAWAISLSGIVAVPALLICSVMLVLHPISNDRYIDPRFGHYIAFVAFVAVAVTAVAVVLWFAWLGLVKPLFFPTWHNASASGHRGNSLGGAGQLANAAKHSGSDTETASRIMEEAEAKHRREMADTARYLAEHGMASPRMRKWLPADYKQKEIENKQKDIEAEVQARFNRKAWWEGKGWREWFEPRVEADTSDNAN
jgi:hypothetical protein